MKMPRTPPDTTRLLERILGSPSGMRAVMESGLYSATVGDRYIHWDKLLRRPPPNGVTHESWWDAIKLARIPLRKPLPLLDKNQVPFAIATPDPMQRQLSELDRDLSGRVSIPEQLTNPGTRDRFVVSALIEEAITSSQLEGASTTRHVAADMLRSGRKPRDDGERMIFNNFAAIRYVGEIAKLPLTRDLVLELHRRVTDATLDDPRDAGRFRRDDSIKVYSRDDDLVLHVPPTFSELPSRMDRLCDFANGKTPEYFLHPIVRAVLLHFWIGFDHPFVDGNGRTARALFYWSMLNSGYWLAEFLSISHFLRKAPAKYSLAYLYAETDENDATYFVLYQLHVLQRAIRELHEYVQGKVDVIKATRQLLKRTQNFNHRQLALLGHALGDPEAEYTVVSHATSHQVTRQTARTDLKDLTELGFLEFEEVGNAVVYTPAPDLERRIEAFGRRMK